MKSSRQHYVSLIAVSKFPKSKINLFLHICFLLFLIFQDMIATKEIPTKSNNRIEDEPSPDVFEDDDGKVRRVPASYSFGLGKKSDGMDTPDNKIDTYEDDIMSAMQDTSSPGSKRDSDFERFHFGLGKKRSDIRDESRFQFGLGKKNDDRSKFAFGLGKRALDDRFAFGLGKRGLDDRFAFGLGKRGLDDRFAFGLGKRGLDDRFAFGLGKRGLDDRFAFGLGKRSLDDDHSRFAFGLGKRGLEDDHSRFAFGLGKRGPEDRFAFGLGKRRPGEERFAFGLGKRRPGEERFAFGLGKRESIDKSFAFNLDSSESDAIPVDIDPNMIEVKKNNEHNKFALGLGKKSENASEQGIEKREAFNDDIDEYIKRRFSFGLGR